MPLPNDGTPWPPGEGSVHHDAVREWSAWYAGHPDILEAYYQPRTGATARPSQFRGGIVGALSRWWWGTPTAAGESRAKLHVPLAADIAGTSADLLFSEPVKLTATADGSDALTKFLGRLGDDGLDSRLHEGAEVQAALGGVYLRTTWDSTVSPTPWTTIIHPDGAVPEWHNGRLVAVNLWSEVGRTDKGRVYRHIERHEPGFIVHRLYEGTSTNLGKRVPLEAMPATAPLVATVNEAGAQATGTQRLTATYVPNMLPNRLNRHSLEGRSDFQGVTPLFDALDEAYSSWWRDIRHAKARLHVPASYLEASDGPGSYAIADVDREVYVPVQTIGNSNGHLQIDAQQFDIRVAEHQQTCEAWTEQALHMAGYSANTFGDGETGTMTATEVQAREKKSYRTRGKKARYWTAGLRAHLAAMAEVANTQLSAGLGSNVEVAVEFPDGVQESQVSLANTALALRNAEAASIGTRVRMVNPDWTEQQVDDEVALIRGESAAGDPLPVPTDAGL